MGAISLNPVILGAVAGPGLLIKTFGDFKRYTQRAEFVWLSPLIKKSLWI